jgi:predicted transposase YdaD
LEQGLELGIIQTAITMLMKFKLPIEEVAKELDISVDELQEYL